MVIKDELNSSVCYNAVCSEISDRSTPVTTVKHSQTADKSDQTKLDDSKFVGRIKMLNIGASLKHRNSVGLFQFLLLLFFFCVASLSGNYCQRDYYSVECYWLALWRSGQRCWSDHEVS